MAAPPIPSALDARTQIFPSLTPSQIDRVRPQGRIRHVDRGEILFDVGDTNIPPVRWTVMGRSPSRPGCTTSMLPERMTKKGLQALCTLVSRSRNQFREFRKINVAAAHDADYLSGSALPAQTCRNSASTSTFRNDMVSFCNDSHCPPNLVKRTDDRSRQQLVRQVPHARKYGFAPTSHEPFTANLRIADVRPEPPNAMPSTREYRMALRQPELQITGSVITPGVTSSSWLHQLPEDGRRATQHHHREIRPVLTAIACHRLPVAKIGTLSSFFTMQRE